MIFTLLTNPVNFLTIIISYASEITDFSTNVERQFGKLDLWINCLDTIWVKRFDPLKRIS